MASQRDARQLTGATGCGARFFARALARGGVAAHPAAMRGWLFASGAAILAIGLSASVLLADRDEALALLHGGLTLGGGLLICGLFSFRMWWHAVIGAGVIALLGLARGAGNLPDLARMAGGSGDRGAAPLLEALAALICLLLLLRVLASLRRERTRRLLADMGVE